MTTLKCLAAAVGTAALVLTAKAADAPRWPQMLAPTSFSAQTTNALIGAKADIVAHYGVGIGLTFHTTNSLASSNAVFTFGLSVDGTNFANTLPGSFSLTIPMNGTNAVTVFTNLPASAAANAKSVALINVANQYTNRLFVDRVGAGYIFDK